MKKIFVTALFFIAVNFQLLKAQNLYDISSITSIDLIFFDSNWDVLMDANYGTDNRILATATVNGVVFDSVGVKYKGNSSYNANQIKNPLTVKLNHIISSQDYGGYSMIKLSNVFKDPSFVREVLAYEMMRNYTTASQSNFANVTMQGNLIGLYTSVEAVNDDFTKTHYYSKNLPLFKGEFGQLPVGCPNQGPDKRTWDYYLGGDSTCYAYQFEIESSYGWNDAMNFTDTFNNYQSEMEKVLYVDRHLWTMAYQNLTVNLDASHNMGHNYYIYKDATQRFNHIIWDLNECFGVFSMIVGGGPGPAPPLSIGDLQQFDPFFQSTNVDMPIMKNVMDNVRYKKMYIAHMKTIMAENFSNGWYLTRANQLQAIIDADVLADPNKFDTYADFQNNVANSVGGSPGIQELMAARVTYINSLTDFQNTQPTISNIINTPTTPNPYNTVDFTCSVTNTNYVYLGYRYSVGSKFEKIEMFDDGAHNDGAAGDGTYGAQITLQASDVEYYIYSENNNVGIFSPERAEYEFYTIAVNGDVAINELSSTNSTIQADQNGEYDDWIELYNNTSSPISLDGYYLSDENSNPAKWTFPTGTTINGNDFLIIWADSDTLQAGLHTNFKLSASGEALYFHDPSINLLDETTFGSQMSNITWGRYPNGTGPFTIMNPTYSAMNSNTPIGIEDNVIEDDEFIVYPNPATDMVNIKFSKNDDSSIYIFNIIGKIVYSTTASDNIKIDVSSWSKGMYLIKTSTGTKKLIIK